MRTLQKAMVLYNRTLHATCHCVQTGQSCEVKVLLSGQVSVSDQSEAYVWTILSTTDTSAPHTHRHQKFSNTDKLTNRHRINILSGPALRAAPEKSH